MLDQACCPGDCQGLLESHAESELDHHRPAVAVELVKAPRELLQAPNAQRCAGSGVTLAMPVEEKTMDLQIPTLKGPGMQLAQLRKCNGWIFHCLLQRAAVRRPVKTATDQNLIECILGLCCRCSKFK